MVLILNIYSIDHNKESIEVIIPRSASYQVCFKGMVEHCFIYLFLNTKISFRLMKYVGIEAICYSRHYLIDTILTLSL